MRGAAGGWPGRKGGIQVAVPDGWHTGVELAGVAQEIVRSLLVTCDVRGPGIQDQPPSGDLLPVPLPQPGTRGVQGGGLVDQLPGLIQIAVPVSLVGSYSSAVGVHATAVARICIWAVGVLGLRAGTPIVTVERRARFRCGWMACGFVRAAAAAGLLPPGGSGTTRILLCHSV